MHMKYANVAVQWMPGELVCKINLKYMIGFSGFSLTSKYQQHLS